jgi:sRNA-binding carbon storage regulator CsrA
MLILARKYGEAVVVGGVDGFSRLLKVTVLEIGRGKVKLGFECSRVSAGSLNEASGRRSCPSSREH